MGFDLKAFFNKIHLLSNYFKCIVSSFYNNNRILKYY
jgi:hypothetical protein